MLRTSRSDCCRWRARRLSVAGGRFCQLSHLHLFYLVALRSEGLFPKQLRFLTLGGCMTLPRPCLRVLLVGL